MKCTFIIRNLNSHYFTSLKSLYSKQLIQTMIGEDLKCQFVTLNAKLIKHNKNINRIIISAVVIWSFVLLNQLEFIFI